MIPYCIRRAALPVTNGVAIEVPERALYPPPTEVLVILTPGAARSGLVSERAVNPCPEKEAS